MPGCKSTGPVASSGEICGLKIGNDILNYGGNFSPFEIERRKNGINFQKRQKSAGQSTALKIRTIDKGTK